MRKVLLISALLALLAMPALAQIEISGGGGYMFPLGDADDEHVGEYIVGGSVGYYLTERFSVGGEIYYHSLGLNETQIANAADLKWTDTSKSITNLVFCAKYLLSTGPVSLYGKFVVGSYEYKESWVEEDGLMNLYSEKLPGYGVGLGFQFQSDGFFGAYIEGVYNSISLEDDWTADSWEYVDLRAGIILKGY